MTKPEFEFQYKRLCTGLKHEPTPEQFEAWWTKIGHAHAADWQEAVTTLLCGIRFPLLDPTLAALEQAQEYRKRLAAQREREQAHAWFNGKVQAAGLSPEERAYNQFRATLLLRAFNAGYADRCKSLHWREAHQEEACPDCAARKRAFSRLQAESLAGWISDLANAQWAQRTPQRQCTYHTGPHTLHRCITDEMNYWCERADGKTEAEAVEAILRVSV